MAYTGLRDRQQGMINTYTNQLKTRVCEESKFFTTIRSPLSVTVLICEFPHLENEARLL